MQHGSWGSAGGLSAGGIQDTGGVWEQVGYWRARGAQPFLPPDESFPIPLETSSP